MSDADAIAACDACLRRAWLLARLGAHLEHARARIQPVLALPDDELVAAVAGPDAEGRRRELDGLDVGALRRSADAAGLALLCRCDARYPSRLRDLQAPPAVLHVAGGLERFLGLIDGDPVAIVGSRRATPYGTEVARSLARSLAATGVTILSGLALGVDAAAHAGALEVDGRTVAVLAGSAGRPYPPSQRGLHRRIVASGAAVSELQDGVSTWRWMFPARNRLIAALSAVTVVVEADTRSGSLVTAGLAAALGREVGAVPGRITSPQSQGCNDLLAAGGARVIRGAHDVLDALLGDVAGGAGRSGAEAGGRSAAAAAGTTRLEATRPPLGEELERLLAALGDGFGTAAAFARAGLSAQAGLVAVAELELAGRLRRGAGGGYTVVP